MLSLKEKIRLFVYDRQGAVLKTLRRASFFMALLSLGLLLYLAGFNLSTQTETIAIGVIKVILVYFIFVYALRFFFSISKLGFLRTTWLEFLLMAMLVVDGISLYLFQFPLLAKIFEPFGIENFTPIYLMFIQLYIVVFAGLEVIRSNPGLSRIRIKFSLGLVISLAILGLLGALLLMMPQMYTGRAPTFLESLFTSVSAISQTGLILVDTGSFWTVKGQFVVMMLIQIGALGIISFSTFFGTYLAQGLNLRQQHMVSEFFTSDSRFKTEDLARQIIFYTIFINLFGAIIIYFLWDPSVVFKSLGDKIFNSIFHSVSAFCNAGFSTFPQGIYTDPVRHSYMLHMALLMLVFLGSVGYPTLHDLFGIHHVRDRLQFAWKKLKLDSQISLYTAIALIVFGAVMFYFLEYNRSMADLKGGPAWITAFFQSVMRTAGFNTVDFSAVGSPMLIVFCFLMFVGGGSGSVCGGIRTSTFAIICVSLWNSIRGKNVMTIGNREITADLYNRVISIFLFATCWVLGATFALTITDPDLPFIKLIFEEVSAFGTCGLSTGITGTLSEAGKWVILLSMYVGRVGTLTLVVALGTQVTKSKYKYPTARIMVG